MPNIDGYRHYITGKDLKKFRTVSRLLYLQMAVSGEVKRVSGGYQREYTQLLSGIVLDSHPTHLMKKHALDKPVILKECVWSTIRQKFRLWIFFGGSGKHMILVVEWDKVMIEEHSIDLGFIT